MPPLDRYRGFALLAYFLLGGLGVVVAWGLELSPFSVEPWIPFPPPMGPLFSVLLGATLALGAVAATRLLVARWGWARALHDELRPAVHGVRTPTLAALALASALGEELFFRGLLLQVLGVVGSSVLFGILHQVRGRARWVWAVWAFVMGLAFAVVFKLTGSLVGPVLAHFLVNLVNLRYLRDHKLAV